MYERKVEIFENNSLVETEFKFLKKGDMFLLDGYDKIIYTATEDSSLSEEGIWGIEVVLSVNNVNKDKTLIVD